MSRHAKPVVPDQDAPLVSRPVNVAILPKKGQRLYYEADAEVLAQLASDFDIDAVENLVADAEIMPWKRGGITVKGWVRASLIQPCAITSDPLHTQIDEIIDLVLVPEGSPLAVPEVSDTGELIIDPEGADLPETFASDHIDLGAIWMEHFALGFDPYARKEDADLSKTVQALNDDDVETDAKPDNPFAALEALKSK
ncbi:MAG: DUF177 domain-containing protein [Pseudomonadota bacterium]